MEDSTSHPVTLQFASRRLEIAFRRAYAAESKRQVRWAILLGVALYGPLFGAMDVVDAPQARHVVWTIRAAVCALALGVYLFTFTERRFERYMQPVLSGLLLLGGLGLAGMLAVEGTGAQYFDGPALIILAAYAAIRLRFAWATAVGWLTTAAYAAVVVAFREEPGAFLLSSVWFMVAANIIGMFAAYGLESYARRVFCQARRIEAKRKMVRATQQQLVHAEKMASLGQLTAGIAHEIKNPLNFVTNFAELHLELTAELRAAIRQGANYDALLDEIEQGARAISQHGKRADAIIKGMMQHARGSSGKRRSVKLNALVADHAALAYHGCRAQVPDVDVVLTEDYDGAVGVVEVQPQELGRVVVNLVTNAFDAVAEYARSRPAESDAVGKDAFYSDAFGSDASLGSDVKPYAPRVAVSTRRTGDRVEIRVADNGPGVPDELRAKIFEPFFTTKPTGSGTGLGLSLSYDIVTQGHGGALSVERAQEGGAAFVVRLPAPPPTTTSPITPTSDRSDLPPD